MNHSVCAGGPGDGDDGRRLGRAAEGQHGSDAEGHGGPGALDRQRRHHGAIQMQNAWIVLSHIWKMLES